MTTSGPTSEQSDRHCAHCEVLLEPGRRSHAVYCSPSCRSRARHQQQKETVRKRAYEAQDVALGRALASIHAGISEGVLRAEFELAYVPGPADHRKIGHLLQRAEAVDPTGLTDRARRITLTDGPVKLSDGTVKPGLSPWSNSTWRTLLREPIKVGVT